MNRTWLSSLGGIGFSLILLILHPAHAQTADPVPARSRLPSIPPKGYLVQEVKDGLYWVLGGNITTMFLVYDRGVIAVDAPPSIGQNYLKAIASITNKPVTHVIYSHWHRDHIGAANLFPNATYIAHEETAAFLARNRNPQPAPPNYSPIPAPTITFKDTYTLSLGEQTLRLDYHGPNHAAGNIFIYAPQQKTLMLVDVITPGWVPNAFLPVVADRPGYIAAHNRALTYDFNAFVGGHVRLGTRADIQAARAYLRDLVTNADTAIQTVDFITVTRGLDPANLYLQGNTYQDAQARECERLTMRKWQNDSRLGGIDTSTFKNCTAMVLMRSLD